MRYQITMATVLVLTVCALPQGREGGSTQIDHFEIGRHTFFDVGPPFDYYEVFIVRAATNGTSIERITLIPPGNACIQPAKIEAASASLSDSVAALLGTSNPCKIPEKELRRELKRSRKYLVFSGAHVAMQVQCGTQTRIIHSDILDRDMFAAVPNTPEHTSWTMQLLARLNQPLGPGVMDKPVFPTGETERSALPDLDSAIRQELSAGDYDALFKDAPQKPSELYRIVQTPSTTSPVELADSEPIYPEVFVAPEYPAMAKIAHVSGSVEVKLDVDPNGNVTGLKFESGPLLLQKAVEAAANGWRFVKDTKTRAVEARISFGLCKQATK